MTLEEILINLGGLPPFANTKLDDQIKYMEDIYSVLKMPVIFAIVESLKELKANKNRVNKEWPIDTKKPFRSESGLTVAMLKGFINGWPETNKHGDPYEVWVGDSYGASNHAKIICRLNEGDLIIE